MKTIYNFSVQDAELKDVSLKDYKGKVLLVVNVASYCGLTYQYESLENYIKNIRIKILKYLVFLVINLHFKNLEIIKILKNSVIQNTE